MGYIGKVHKSTSVPARTISMLTGDGVATILNLSQQPISASNVSVSIGGVTQTPEIDYTLSGSQITFSEAIPAGSWVCAMINGGETIASPMDGSVTTDTIVNGAITNAKIISMDASKITGSAYPALNASAITFDTVEIFDKNSSDPTVTSNKTLGTVWVNTTTGGIFVLTDATTDQNIWLNVGGGTNSIEYVAALRAFGSSFGFTSGGSYPDIGNIQKYAFSSGTTTVTVGQLSVTRYTGESGTSSFTHGYCVAGYNNTNNTVDRTIDKFEFATSSNATGVGDCVVGGNVRSGAQSETHGYIGGNGNVGPVNGDKIEKYSFATDASSVNVATLSAFRTGLTGVSSPTTGYFAGGRIASTYVDDIESITFSSDTANGDIGSLSGTRRTPVGHQTTTYGYVAGGMLSGAFAVTNIVDCFAFASSVTTTDVGDMDTGRAQAAPASSTTHGYTAGGGIAPEGTNTSIIERYQFASGNAITSTNVGNLAVAHYASCGHQV